MKKVDQPADRNNCVICRSISPPARSAVNLHYCMFFYQFTVTSRLVGTHTTYSCELEIDRLVETITNRCNYDVSMFLRPRHTAVIFVDDFYYKILPCRL